MADGNQMAETLVAALRRAVELLRADETLRGHARLLLTLLAEGPPPHPEGAPTTDVAQPPPADAPDTAGPAPAGPPISVPDANIPPPDPAPDPAAALVYAQSGAGTAQPRRYQMLGRPPAPVVYSTSDPHARAPLAAPSDTTLLPLAQRLRLKRRAADWAARYAARESAPATEALEAERRSLLAEAKSLPDCYLWMLGFDPVTNDLPENWETLGTCYDATAEAVELLDAIRSRPSADAGRQSAIELVAEATSALRVAVSTLTQTPDRDQDQLFRWLRGTTTAEQIYVRRYMRLEDPADPAAMPALAERARQQRDQLATVAQGARDVGARFKKLRYHAKRIQHAPGEDHAHDWNRVMECIDALVAAGLPPSSVDIRDVLLPIYDTMPDLADIPVNVDRVCREVDRYLDTRRDAAPPPTLPGYDNAVARVAQRLRGQTVLLIGGDPREDSRRALEQAFGLRKLIWLETNENNTRIQFEGDIADPDVSMVWLLLRWVRHAFNEARSLAREHGKACVTLRAGYNANRVAYDILQQEREADGT